MRVTKNRKRGRSGKGIAFTGGEGPTREGVLPYLKDAAMVVAADSGLELAHRLEVTVDVVVGDMDSLKERSLLQKYDASAIRSFPKDKDHTDTEIACELLFERGCSPVYLVGGGGEELDHLLAIYALFHRERTPDLWITSREVARVVRGTARWRLSRGEIISFFPLGKAPYQVRSEGLRWPLDDLSWDLGECSARNESMGGVVEVNVLEGAFLAISPLFPCHET